MTRPPNTTLGYIHMTNTTRRAVACLVGLALLGLLVAIVLPQHPSSTEVVTGDDTTPTIGTTAPPTTAVPETTTAESTTTTVAPATTVVDTTVPPTTVAPEPSTTEPPAENVAAATVDAQAIHESVQADATQPAVRSGPVCTTDPEYCNPPTTPPRAEWRYCEEWHELAAEVGWPEDQGRVLSYVLHRESGCDPHAYNPSTCGKGNHAMGLMQLCGWLPSYLAYDPRANLEKGLELWQHSGWCPWVLRGDPVTGRACG